MKRLFKYASLLMAAVMLLSCSGQQDSTGGIGDASSSLLLTSDKNLIQAGEDVAILSLTLDGVPVTEGVTFFNENNEVLDIADFKFSTETPGEYTLWAAYGALNSNKISIMAVATAIPPTPQDPQPENTNFKSRVLLSQFTGVNCGYCPQMMLKLHPVLEDKTMANELVWVACHSYSNGDVAYFPRAKYADILGGTFPSLNLDFTYKFENTSANDTEALIALINECNTSKKDLASGIAVNAKLVDGQVVAKVTVKAAETAEYRVGAMLLEDGLKQTQTSASEAWMHQHDACIRYIDAGGQAAGNKLGTIEKGKTADYLFIWNLDKIWSDANKAEKEWDAFVLENLRMAVYVVSTRKVNGQESYYVNNAVAAEFNKETPFEYAK